MLPRASTLVALVALAACDAVPTPDSPARAVVTFAAAVESAERDANQRRRLYELLSQRAKGGLEARAARAAQVSGRPMEPWEMIAPGRLRLRLSPNPDAITARESGERAVVTVRGRTGGVADVPLVREGGRWRVDLALPPIVAPGPAERVERPAERVER